MFEAARLVGQATREVHACARGDWALGQFNVDFNVSFIIGGQIRWRGNAPVPKSTPPAISSKGDAGKSVFQIGEAKCSKPILDRVITPETSLDDAAKCALVSMDSTLQVIFRSVCRWICWCGGKRLARDQIQPHHQNPYFQMIHRRWGKRLLSALKTWRRRFGIHTLN